MDHCFVDKCRENMLLYNNKEVAMNASIEWCIQRDILRDFLISNRSEVEMRTLYEWDPEKYERLVRKEGFEEGKEVGIEEGIEIGTEKGTEKNFLLYKAMKADDRLDEFDRAADDKELFQKLVLEYKL